MSQDDLGSGLRQHSYQLQVDASVVGAEGGQILLQEAQESQFVVVGEEHGNVETPRFVGALLRSLESYGYHTLALEVSPFASALLQELAESGDAAQRIRDFGEEHRIWFPFFSEYRAEADLLEVTSGRPVSLWGLDQEFYFTTAYLLHRLVELAPSEEAKSFVERFHNTEIRKADADSTRRNPNGRFFQVVTMEDFETLGHFYAGQPAGIRALEELKVSWGIYAARDNAARAVLMDRHLREYLARSAEAGDSVPRVLFKLGGVHAGRGLNALGVPDVGSSVSELATASGSKSLHLIVLPRADLIGSPVLLEFQDVETSWTLVDLRPYRRSTDALPTTVGDEDLYRFALRYDFAVLAPRFTPSPLLPR